MQALFVHGMGRSPILGWRLLARLKAQGITPHAFGYVATFQRCDAIRQRLINRIQTLAACGDYVLIGHSLGGVLLRAAIAGLPQGTRLPRQIFLLGSPIQPSRLAHRLHRNLFFRLLAGDCGQLLASATRMSAIGPSPVPAVAIQGTTGWRGRFSPFGDAVNDGLVAVAETNAAWLSKTVQVPVLHTYMPSHRRVSRLILDHLTAHPPA